MYKSNDDLQKSALCRLKIKVGFRVISMLVSQLDSNSINSYIILKNCQINMLLNPT